MHASGTPNCSAADVFSLMWDSEELPRKTWPYEAMFSGKHEPLQYIYIYIFYSIPNNY